MAVYLQKQGTTGVTSLSGVTVQASNKPAPSLFDAIKKNIVTVTDSNISVPKKILTPGGAVSGTPTSTFPQVGNQITYNMTQTLKPFCVRTRGLLSDPDATPEGLELRKPAMIAEAEENFRRMIYGDGTGFLGTVQAYINSKKIALTHITRFHSGMYIDFYSASTNEPIEGATGLRISGILIGDEILTFDVDVPATVAEGDFVTVQGSYNKELTGLQSIFAASEIYGLTRASHYWLRAYGHGASAIISVPLIQAMIDGIQLWAAHGQNTNYIFCSRGVKRAWMSYLVDKGIDIETVELQDGRKAPLFFGIPMIEDRYCPSKSLYGINTDAFVFHQLGDWEWVEEGGSIIHPESDGVSYTATLAKTMELMCTNIQGQGRFTNITES